MQSQAVLDHALEEPARRGHRTQGVDRGRTRRLPAKCDVARIAAESLDVALHPAQRRDHVEQSGVVRRARNGLLEVESTVVGTNQKQALVIEPRAGALTAEQIADAREAMKRLKHHPRASLPNRTALARADALFLELVGLDRNLLGEAIAVLRLALETHHPQAIEPARRQLIELTDHLRV